MGSESILGRCLRVRALSSRQWLLLEGEGGTVGEGGCRWLFKPRASDVQLKEAKREPGQLESEEVG